MNQKGFSSILIMIVAGAVFLMSASYLAFWHYSNFPKNLTTTEGKGSIIVKWDEVAQLGFSHYEVYREEVGTVNSKLIGNNVNANSYEDTSAEPQKKYQYTVEAVNIVSLKSNPGSSLEYSWSSPNKPSNIKITIQENRAQLNWDKAIENGVTGYNIYRSSDTQVVGQKINDSPVAANSYLDKSFTTDGDYYYQLRAIDAAGNESTQSETITNLLEAPNNLRVTEGKAFILIEWDKTTLPNFSHYVLYRTTQHSGEKKVLQDNITTNSFKDTNVENGIDYFYYLKVFTKDAQRSGLSKEVVGRLQKPAPPSNVAGAINEKGVHLTWSPNSENDVVGYNIYIATPAAQMLKRVNTQIIEGTSYDDFSINKNDAYRFYGITAVDKAGNEGGYSNSLRVTLKPNAPLGFNLKRDYENQNLVMVISWMQTNDPSFSHYELYRAPYSYPQTKDIVEPNLLTNSYTDKSFANSTALFYFVRSVNILGIHSDFTRFYVNRDGTSLMSSIDLSLVKNLGDVPSPGSLSNTKPNGSSSVTPTTPPIVTPTQIPVTLSPPLTINWLVPSGPITIARGGTILLQWTATGGNAASKVNFYLLSSSGELSESRDFSAAGGIGNFDAIVFPGTYTLETYSAPSKKVLITVMGTAPKVSSSSTIELDDVTEIIADGACKASVLATVLDEYKVELPGKKVELQSNRPTSDTIFPQSLVTDEYGEMYFSVVSTAVGTSTLTAMADGVQFKEPVALSVLDPQEECSSSN